MLWLFRARWSPEELATRVVPPIVEQWLESFDTDKLQLPSTPGLQRKAEREWVLMQLCAFVTGGYVALGTEARSHWLLDATHEKAVELVLHAGLFSSQEEITRLFAERLQAYGGSQTAQDIVTRFERLQGLQSGSLLRRATLSSAYFSAVEYARELFCDLRKSVRWRRPSRHAGP